MSLRVGFLTLLASVGICISAAGAQGWCSSPEITGTPSGCIRTAGAWHADRGYHSFDDAMVVGRAIVDRLNPWAHSEANYSGDHHEQCGQNVKRNVSAGTIVAATLALIVAVLLIPIASDVLFDHNVWLGAALGLVATAIMAGAFIALRLR